MARIRWTPQSTGDLDNIAEYIAADSPHYARHFVLNVIATIERLDQFPELGRVVPELNDRNVRELLVGSYRIVYRLTSEIVEILTIYHGSRLLDLSGLQNKV